MNLEFETIDTGSEGNLRGDPANIGGGKVNRNFQKVKDALATQPRLDLSAPALTASLRDDGAGNLALYVGPAGAADGDQIKVATVDKASGAVTWLASIRSLTGEFGGPGEAGIVILAPNLGIASSAFVARGSSAGYNAGGAEIYAGGNNRVHILPNGKIGIDTLTPGAKLHVKLAPSAAWGGDWGSWSFAVGGGAALEGALALTYDDTNGAQMGAIVPGVIWKPLRLRSNTITFSGDGAVDHLRLTGTGNLLALVDNTQTNGGPSNRWASVHAGTGAIITSDAHEKVTPDGAEITEPTGWQVSAPTEAEMRVAGRLRAALGWYKFKDAVAAKGLEAARRHFGLTVQFALQVCAEEGVDPWSIGIFCRDEITRRVKVTRTVRVQKTEPDPETDIVEEIVDGNPTLVRKARPPKPVTELRPLKGLDGEIVMLDGEVVTRPAPVMIDVPEDHWIDEPAGDRLGFREGQLALFMLAGEA